MANIKLVDLQINIDGLRIGGGETVDDFIDKINSLTNSNYKVTYQILYEEEFDD